MSSEALRLADLFELEQDPESLYRQAASIASLESERDKLRAEVERLRTHVANLRGAMWHIRYVVVDIEAAKAVARDELGRAIEAAKDAP